jgi:O-antigen/teichoic acid export membrane protein
MTKPLPLATSVSRAMFWNTALFPVKTLLSFASSIILVRALAQTEFAALTSVIAVLNTIGLFSDLGVERTLSKFLPEFERNFGRRGVVRFLWTISGVKVGLLAILILALNLSANFFSDYFKFGANGHVFILAISVLLVLGAASDILLQSLYAYFKQKATNALSIAFAALHPLLVIIFVVAGWGVPGVLLALAISTAVNVALSIPPVSWTLRELALAPTHFSAPGAWRDVARRFANLSLLNYFFNLSVFFYDMPFVVTVLSNAQDTLGVALFGLAYNRLVNPILQFLLAPLTGIQQPLFARLYIEKDTRKLQEAYASLTRFLILFLVPAGVGLSVLARNLIRIFFQSRYEDAALISVLLITFLFAEAVVGPSHNILLAHERIRAVVITRVIALASIPLLLLAAPVYGVVGATIAAGIGRVGSRLAAAIYAGHAFALQFPFGFLMRVSLASALMEGAMLVPLDFLQRPSTPLETVLQTGLAFVVGCAAFAFALKLFGGLDASDKLRLSTLGIPFHAYLMRWL